MKRVIKPLIFLISLSVIFISCGDDAGLHQQFQNQETELNQLKSELDSLYNELSTQEVGRAKRSQSDISALKAKPISFCDAEKLVNAYKASTSNYYLKAKPETPGDPAPKMHAFHVPRAELMKFIDPNGWNLDGIRFYIAEDRLQGEAFHTFVLVGTESDGNDGFNDVWTCDLIQYIEPCPTFCDNARPSGQEFGDALTSNCRTVRPCVNNP